jgi:hypothetical protein
VHRCAYWHWRFAPESPKIADLMHQTPTIVDTLAWFRSIRLLSELESRIVESLFEPCFEFAEAVKLAESIHIHIKVEDTETLPFDDFVQHGGARASGKAGYGKYYFPGGLNLIFSTIPIAQDDLRETEDFKRPRPFLDHIGIDLREESDIVRAGFKKLSSRADELGWGDTSRKAAKAGRSIAATSKSPRSAGSIRRPDPTAPASHSSSPSARSR